MGRNPNDIQTYLKDFDINSIVEANNKSLVVGLPLFKEIAKKEEDKRNEEIRKILKEQGDLEGLEKFEGYLRWRERN